MNNDLNTLSVKIQFVFHTDALGSVAALTGEDGGVAQEYTYAAFGGIKDQTGTDMSRITYTAREALGDSLGFYYYRNRVMDPTTGRFTTEDPLGFIDGPNRYVYVRNNPMLWIDPLGRQWALAGGGAIGDAAAAAGAGSGGFFPAAACYGAAWVGWTIGEAIDEEFGLSDKLGEKLGSLISQFQEHTKKKRPSTEEKHQKGKARKKKDCKGGEKGDKRRPY